MVGIGVSGLAGMSKEKERSPEQKAATATFQDFLAFYTVSNDRLMVGQVGFGG